MLKTIAIGTLLMTLTTIIHSGFMMFSLRMLERQSSKIRPISKLRRMAVVPSTILLLFGAAFLEASVWAVTFLIVGAISSFEPALYFSMVTYTTLGYGDVILDERWRLLGSFEAANGIIIFGWTTALVISVVQRTYSSQFQRAYGEEDS